MLTPPPRAHWRPTTATGRIGLVAALGALLGLAGQAAAVDDTSAEVHLWPVLENSTLADGKHRVWALGLYHRTTNPDGSTYSWHVFNYIRSREFSAALPLWYQVGPPERRHSMLVPFWFQGPDYVAAPLLLTGRWKTDSGKTLWVTPLFHLDTKHDGSFDDLHLLTYFKGENYQVLFPLAYESGLPGKQDWGIVPFWFAGPGYWVAPLALSGGGRTDRGETRTWITPLAHIDRDRDGRLEDFHALNYLHGRTYDVLFPLVWSTGRGGNRHFAVFPAYFQGERWWFVPPAITGGWTRRDGSRETWVTPLAHLNRDAHGRVIDAHLLTYVHGEGYDVLFPLLWMTGREGHRHYAVVPVWFGGERWWCAPPLLSGAAKHHDGSSALWITPLFHVDRDAAGAVTSSHLGPWIESKDFQALIPFYYRQGPPGQRHVGIVPLWFQGPGYRCAPLALTLWHRRDDGSRSLWVTPLFHLDTERDGGFRSAHALSYFQGRFQGGDYQVLFPLAYQVRDGDRRWRGVVPLWCSGPHWWAAPLALSGGWQRNDGGSSTWITPLAHVARNASGSVDGFHVANYVHDRRHDVLFPIVWCVGKPGEKKVAVVPLWFNGPDWQVCPPLLSAHWRCDDGGHATWITPLFHRRTGADGALRHEHLLTWVATPSFQTAFPIYWSWRTEDGGNRSLLAPLYYHSSGGDGDATTTVAPALFSYHHGERLNTSVGYQLFPFIVQNAKDGHEVNVLWRLFHLRETKGVTECMVAPLWWSEHHPGAPARWQVLGGLLARNCNYQSGNYRYYALWLIPLGGHGHFTPPAAAPAL